MEFQNMARNEEKVVMEYTRAGCAQSWVVREENGQGSIVFCCHTSWKEVVQQLSQKGKSGERQHSYCAGAHEKLLSSLRNQTLLHLYLNIIPLSSMPPSQTPSCIRTWGFVLLSLHHRSWFKRRSLLSSN